MKFKLKKLSEQDLCTLLTTLRASDVSYFYDSTKDTILTTSNDDCILIEELITANANTTALGYY